MDEKVAKTPRPHMLDADEVAELLRIKKGSAYEVIRKINAERMGHEAVDITYRYAHLFPTKQDEMAAALDGARG